MNMINDYAFHQKLVTCLLGPSVQPPESFDFLRSIDAIGCALLTGQCHLQPSRLFWYLICKEKTCRDSCHYFDSSSSNTRLLLLQRKYNLVNLYYVVYIPYDLFLATIPKFLKLNKMYEILKIQKRNRCRLLGDQRPNRVNR